MSTCLVQQVYKFYSRDWLVQGRVRVELKDASGKPLNPEIPTRKHVMLNTESGGHLLVSSSCYHGVFSMAAST